MSENLLEVVKKGESEEVELKKSPAQLERALKSVCSFLNHTGGRVYFGIKYIEQWGTGTNDMVAGCINWGLPEPEFELVTGDLVVTFRKDIFTEEYLKINKTLTSKKYAELFSITERMARNDLKELINKKIIERKGVSDKTTYYILAEI